MKRFICILSLWTLKVLSQSSGGTNKPDLPKLAMGYFQNITFDSSSCLACMFRSSLFYDGVHKLLVIRAAL